MIRSNRAVWLDLGSPEERGRDKQVLSDHQPKTGNTADKTSVVSTLYLHIHSTVSADKRTQKNITYRIAIQVIICYNIKNVLWGEAE